MQQYFIEPLMKQGEIYTFTKEQAHHLRDVLRLNHETVRLVDPKHAWFAECYSEGKDFVALIKEEDPRVNEPSIDITLAMALIRREKFELVLQKAAELGVKRIVPFESSRCVVRAKSEKSEKQKERYRSIVLSASEQCKRNVIPEVTDVVKFSELDRFRSEVSLAAYENASVHSVKISERLNSRSVTVVIGPEGGFSEEEVKELIEMGYEPVTLGSRILRAETAALYACSVIAEGAF